MIITINKSDRDRSTAPNQLQQPFYTLLKQSVTALSRQLSISYASWSLTSSSPSLLLLLLLLCLPTCLPPQLMSKLFIIADLTGLIYPITIVRVRNTLKFKKPLLSSLASVQSCNTKHRYTVLVHKLRILCS